MGEKIKDKARDSYEGLESYEVGYDKGYNDGFEDCKTLILNFMLDFLETQGYIEEDN